MPRFKHARLRGRLAAKFPDTRNPENKRALVEATNMPNVYDEQPGQPSNITPQQCESKFRRRVKPNSLIDCVNNLPNGYRTTLHLEGYPLGYLVILLRINQVDTSGLYFSGKCVNFRNVESDGVISQEVESVDVREFPLDKVYFQDPTADFFNGDLFTRIEEFLGDMNRIHLTSFREYIDSIESSMGGSDSNLYFLFSDCFICRRTNPRPPNCLKALTRIVKTGGLSNMLTEDYEFKFSFNGKEYEVFIPDGKKQCFDRCVEHGFIVANGGDCCYDMNLESELESGLSPSARLRTEIEGIQCDIKEKRILASNKNLDKVGLKDRAKYDKKFAKGYTTNEMKKQSILYAERDVNVYCYRYAKDGLFDCCEIPDRPSGMSTVNVTLFKMTDSGKILSYDDPIFINSETGSGMLHAITVFPFNKNSLNGSQKDFIKELEKHTTAYMDSIYARVKYVEETEESLSKLVEFQHSRYRECKTNTLIAHPDLMSDRMNVSNGGKRKIYHGYEEQKEYYVFVYDLETVCNTNNIQDQVYEPFRKISEREDHAPLEAQIPFSAQWVPVNVSDSGKYKRKKEKEEFYPRVEDVPDISPPIEEGCCYPTYHDVMLDEVQTEYGDDLLGKCVEDMFMNVAMWIHTRGGRVGYMYAHNGCGFDAYVCLQFCRFPIKTLLKTSRGVLSMSVKVKVSNEDSEEEKFVYLVLRDTKVHVPGSLDALCKSFGVPKVWKKLDFPIQLIHAGNCYKKEVKEVCKPYGENDVKSLAFIVKKINEMIMNSDWEPASISTKPPITQFLTCMSMVKASTRNHFIRHTRFGVKGLSCHAVDVPALRHWLSEATMGGRVSAYGRTYLHYMFGEIIDCVNSKNIMRLQEIHKVILNEKSAMQVLDVTSLYPTAQSQCPMPVGALYSASISMCEESIQSVGCKKCEEIHTLCTTHRDDRDMRPFLIILVKNCIPGKSSERNYIGRKLYSDNKTGLGLLYSLETREEVNARYGKEVLREIQAYCNVDLYWMRKQGYTFDIVGGFGWGVSMIYKSFIEPAFEKRIKAKQDGNKVLSDFYKLNYNSAYGVTAQRDITDCGFVADVPEELRELHYMDPAIYKLLSSGDVNKEKRMDVDENLIESIPLRNGQVYFVKEKKEHLNEFYQAQSPMQIGCAVLAWSRHIMNLIMFDFPVETMTYTDTDSICISDKIVQDVLRKTPHLIDGKADAWLGSLKNDHAEDNGAEPRVIASFIGTKKVKMHITLNEEGKVKIFNTFKGLNPSCNDSETGRRMHTDYVDNITSQALLEINEKGYMNPIEVSQWKRNLENGITIGTHQQKSEMETYLDHSVGVYFVLDDFNNFYEFFSPHGVKGCYLIEEERTEMIEKSGFMKTYAEVKDFIASLYPKKDKVYEVDSEEYRNVVRILSTN
jgi:hypothetical protein